MKNKGQATLEFSIIIIMVIALGAAFYGIAMWSISQMDGRQGAFEGSRTGAGSKGSPGEPRRPFQASPM